MQQRLLTLYLRESSNISEPIMCNDSRFYAQIFPNFLVFLGISTDYFWISTRRGEFTNQGFCIIFLVGETLRKPSRTFWNLPEYSRTHYETDMTSSRCHRGLHKVVQML